jgi:glycerophosphoryl diester phosphodiesterase
VTYPRVIAHRCGGVLAAENSLAGLAAAERLGCRGVEFDVMLSADGVPVLMHDDTVDRITGGTGAVRQLTVAELRRLRVGGEPVPLLAEALQRCTELGLWANIELKSVAGGDDAELGDVVGRMLEREWNGHGVISSFSMAALRVAQSQASRYAYALLFEALPGDWRKIAEATAAVAVHLDADRLDGQALAELRSAGLSLACYTVNERDRAMALYAAGVAAVFTDRPDLFSRDEM